eukprot:678124-Amphidinium_carterae.1
MDAFMPLLTTYTHKALPTAHQEPSACTDWPHSRLWNTIHTHITQKIQKINSKPLNAYTRDLHGRHAARPIGRAAENDRLFSTTISPTFDAIPTRFKCRVGRP